MTEKDACACNVVFYFKLRAEGRCRLAAEGSSPKIRSHRARQSRRFKKKRKRPPERSKIQKRDGARAGGRDAAKVSS